MGTVQVIFVEDRTIAHAWPEVTLVTWPEVCSAHAQPFSPEVSKSRDRKRPCPALPFSRISPRTIFPYIFFLVLPPYFFPVFFSTVLFSRTFSEMLKFISFGFFLILFYLERKDTPILEDYINDTLKDARNRSWRSCLFVFKTLSQEDWNVLNINQSYHWKLN